MATPELYLFTGPEAGEKNEAIANIRRAAAQKNGQLDEYTYYAADTRVQDVVAQLQNQSLFSAALFIVLRGAEQIKGKADTDLLAQWAKGGATESPNTLILVSDENSAEKKLEALVPPEHKKIFWELFENRKAEWLHGFFRKNGFSATDEAVESILDMVENNTESLRAECSRFFYCFERGHTVTPADVEKILAHNREENAFTLFEAMADPSRSPRQRFETALGILQKIRVSREGGGVQIMAGLSYCYRQLRAWHRLTEGGARPTDTQLRAAGFSGKKNQARYQGAARVWGAGATASILALLANSDMQLREGGAALEDTRLVMLVYCIVIKGGLFPAPYERGWSQA